MFTAMMSSQVTNCSKPVAVVAPRPRLTDNPELLTAQSLAASEQTSICTDTVSTKFQIRATSVPSGHHRVLDTSQWCSENGEDEDAVDRRTCTCVVKPTRRVVEPDDDDGLMTCPFYHGNITSDEAKRRLAGRSRGTYLLRDSQSASFPFSLSVRTSGRSAVTSLRIARVGNNFRLDCDKSHRASMPTFGSVLRLLTHFIAESDGGEGGRCVLVGSSERQEEPLTLRQPLHRPATVN